MTERAKPTKTKVIPITNYKDLRLRQPRADFQVKEVKAWLARILKVPTAAVQLMLPGGKRRARSDKTLGALRKDWRRTW